MFGDLKCQSGSQIVVTHELCCRLCGVCLLFFRGEHPTPGSRRSRRTAAMRFVILQVFSAPYTSFCGNEKLRKKLKFYFCRNFSHVRSIWERKDAARIFQLWLQLLRLTIIARWEVNVCKLCSDKSCDEKFRGGISANHVKHLRRPTHIDSLAPRTRAKSPRQMNGRVKTLV